MILGLDISSSSTGYGILSDDGKLVTFGQFRPSTKLGRSAKYVYIANKVRSLCDEYTVDKLVLEAYFVGGFRNQSTFVCAELRGHVKAVISQEFPEIIVVEDIYPSSLKKIVTGSGRAEKVEVAKCILNKMGVQYMDLKGGKSKCTFIVGEAKYYDDASDAISLAYCHYIKKEVV